ncbi:hypothetical protein A5765_17775 [Mycolicibacterium celeriflavum]|nr:hypothetical protein [Mycolicibacterium celeriflavum]MCV7240576.1 hypothetical protein [Mycolicibacterium celeriflavum]OBG24381.1 hypothetical protein A5765_17775 [Mycolicibacterium celeriflavum]ORA48059.1 hypothetical protein BST21_10580 [Mycolicibacterium celeriflavum]
MPALIGNVIGLLAVLAKTAFDLWINPRLYDRDIKSMERLDAAKEKRDRLDKSTLWTFIAVGISYFFSISALVRFD